MLKDRIAAAMTARNMTAADLARACQVKPPSVSAWLSGDTKSLRADVLLKAARALDVEPEWLAAGTGPMQSGGAGSAEPPAQDRSDEVEIPLYNARGAAGDGAVNGPSVMIGSLTFKRRSLERKGLNPSNLATIYVDGESMAPGIGDGDVVIFDRSRSTVRHGEVYVLRYDDELLVKRLHKLADGGLLLVSDNTTDPRYAARPIPLSHLDDVQILGQVVWGGGWF